MTYSLMELATLAGPMIWPLLACFILAVTITVERLVTLRAASRGARRFLDDISDAVRRNKIAEALGLCERHHGPLVEMVRGALAKHGAGREVMRQAIEDAGYKIIPKLEQHVPTLGTIASVAPLLGLLGTVLGLIRCFQAVQAKEAALQPVGPADLANGMWQALLTTAAGLAITVLAIVAYNHCARRAHLMVREMEGSATELLNLMMGEPL